MVDFNLQGGVKNRSSTFTVAEIHQKIAKIKADKNEGALITLDQSVAFDIILHTLLAKKLAWIGLENESIDILLSYLSDRKQYVHINGHNSDILLTGDVSVGQGSIISGLFFLIMTMDMHAQMHAVRHNSHAEDQKCKNISMQVYVDDCFGLITADKNKNEDI